MLIRRWEPIDLKKLPTMNLVSLGSNNFGIFMMLHTFVNDFVICRGINQVRRQNVPPHLAPPRRHTVPIVHSLCISASVGTFGRRGESGTFCRP